MCISMRKCEQIATAMLSIMFNVTDLAGITTGRGQRAWQICTYRPSKMGIVGKINRITNKNLYAYVHAINQILLNSLIY